MSACVLWHLLRRSKGRSRDRPDRRPAKLWVTGLAVVRLRVAKVDVRDAILVRRISGTGWRFSAGQVSLRDDATNRAEPWWTARRLEHVARHQ
jgi:hypothetical protein